MPNFLISLSEIESLITITAIILGGFWTYLLFIKHREKYPKALIRHKIHQINVENEILIRLTIQIENIGGVILPITSGEVWLQQWRPVDNSVKEAIDSFKILDATNKTEIGWPIIDKRTFNYNHENDYELEPGEIDKFEFDFITEKAVDVIQFYTHIENAKKSNKGWNNTSIHKLKTND